MHTEGGVWAASLSDSDARMLSVPAIGANELPFLIITDDHSRQVLLRFSLDTFANRLEPYAEYWPSEAFWDRAALLDPHVEQPWRNLQLLVAQLRDVADPNW